MRCSPTGFASLVRVAATYNFFLLLAACASAPPPPAAQADARRLAAQAQADEKLARAVAEKARAERAAADAARIAETRAREAEIAREQARVAEAQRLEAAQAAQSDLAGADPVDMGAELKRLRAALPELQVRKSERGWVLILRNEALFDPREATLKPGARRAVDRLAQVMRDHPQRDVAIEGFTDAAGSEEANRRLSASRAEEIKRALVERGVDPLRVDARGYGPAFPVASNETPGGRELNRRMEIVINPS